MNERLKNVDNAATLDGTSEKEILERGGACFVHKNGELLGGGWLANGELLLIAAAVPGAGERVMHTLMSLQPDEPIELEVASTNTRAIRLYEKLGFVKASELRQWYKVF
jgi:predicted GNAT family acetyltransferase